MRVSGSELQHKNAESSRLKAERHSAFGVRYSGRGAFRLRIADFGLNGTTNIKDLRWLG